VLFVCVCLYLHCRVLVEVSPTLYVLPAVSDKSMVYVSVCEVGFTLVSHNLVF
jgi:hypothetical protein